MQTYSLSNNLMKKEINLPFISQWKRNEINHFMFSNKDGFSACSKIFAIDVIRQIIALVI